MQFYWHILENIQLESNRVDNLEALYCTMALLAVELGGEDIIVDLFRLALDIQVKFTRRKIPPSLPPPPHPTFFFSFSMPFSILLF